MKRGDKKILLFMSLSLLVIGGLITSSIVIRNNTVVLFSLIFILIIILINVYILIKIYNNVIDNRDIIKTNMLEFFITKDYDAAKLYLEHKMEKVEHYCIMSECRIQLISLNLRENKNEEAFEVLNKYKYLLCNKEVYFYKALYYLHTDQYDKAIYKHKKLMRITRKKPFYVNELRTLTKLIMCYQNKGKHNVTINSDFPIVSKIKKDFENKLSVGYRYSH